MKSKVNKLDFLNYLAEFEGFGLDSNKKSPKKNEQEKITRIAEKIFSLDPYQKSQIQNWIDLNVILYNLKENKGKDSVQLSLSTAKNVQDLYQELLKAPINFVDFLRQTQLPFMIGRGFYLVNTFDPKPTGGKEFTTAKDMPEHVRVLRSIEITIGLFTDSLKIASHFGTLAGLIFKGQIIAQAQGQVKILKEIKTDSKYEKIIDNEIDALNAWIEAEGKILKKEWKEFAREGLRDSISFTRRIFQGIVLRSGGASSKTGRVLGPLMNTLSLGLGVVDFIISYYTYKKSQKGLKRIKKWEKALEPKLQVEFMKGTASVFEKDVQKFKDHLKAQKKREKGVRKKFEGYLDGRVKDSKKGTYFSFRKIKKNLAGGDFPIDLEEVEMTLRNRALSKYLVPDQISDFLKTPVNKREAFLKKLEKDKKLQKGEGKKLLKQLERSKICKPQDLERKDVRSLMFHRYNGKRQAMNQSIKNGIQTLAVEKAAFEKKLARFSKNLNVVSLVTAFCAVLLSIGYLAAFPASLLVTTGLILLAGGILLFVIGHLHQRKYKPNTWKATYSKMGIKVFLQRIRRAFYRYRLAKKFNIEKESSFEFLSINKNFEKLQEELVKETKKGYKRPEKIKKLWRKFGISPSASKEKKEKLLKEYEKKVEANFLKRSKKPAKEIQEIEEKLEQMERAIARYEDFVMEQSWIDYNKLHKAGRYKKEEIRFGLKKVIEGFKQFGLRKLGKIKDKEDPYNDYQKILEDDLPEAIIDMIENHELDKETQAFLKLEIGFDLEKLEKLPKTDLEKAKEAIRDFFTLSDERLRKFVKKRVVIEGI